ncbi:MAG: hypothetical protein MJK07_01730 [Flavobacteriales bacterium]|nr:hypothetical protein [Flavobacteriales bacterium]
MAFGKHLREGQVLVNVEQRGVFSLSEFWKIEATRFYSFLGIAYGTSFENYSWDWFLGMRGGFRIVL